jgi:ribosome-interacting GTPase 1
MEPLTHNTNRASKLIPFPLSPQCYNKVDTVSLEEVDRLARLPHSVVISCELELNFDTLLSLIWDYLSLLRLYTKRRGGID